MSATIIKLLELPGGDGDVQIIFQIEEPQDVADADQARRLACDPTTVPFSDLSTVPAADRQPIGGDLVQVAGEKLLEALSEHPGVRQAIDQAVNSPDGGPIYFQTSAIDAEAVPWEMLFHPQGSFLSLDPRWPVARQAGRKGEPILHQFEPPLRIAAVLGAAEVDATPEWHALRGAVANSVLPCRITALVSQPALQAAIEAQADPFVAVEPIPDAPDALLARLKAFEPQLLHVFCHGSTDYPGYLEIATRAHAEVGDPPLFLSSAELARLRDVVWLITLDACEGAAPAEELHSFAYSLVKDGVPAAIGMREPIDSLDASVFCGAFYGAALSELGGELEPDTNVELNWAPLLRAARAALCRQYPGPTDRTAARHKHWTLPVLYQRPTNSVVVTAPADGGLSTDEHARSIGELETLREVRAELHPDTPQNVIEQIDEAILALEQQLANVAVPG